MASTCLFDRTGGSGFKLKEGRFRLDTRKKFFTMKVLKHQNRLPRDMVDASSLETFKVRLHEALSNLVQLKMSLLIAGELDQMTCEGPFQPKLFYDSMILFDFGSGQFSNDLKKRKKMQKKKKLLRQIKGCLRKFWFVFYFL